MLARTVSHRYADLILDRNFKTEWAEVLGAIGELRTPVRCHGESLWSRLRAQLISGLTRLAWLPDLSVPSWHQEHRSDMLIHVDLEKHGIALMVADSHRGLYGDLFALNAAGAASQSDVGIYVVATTGLVGTNGSPVATLEDVSLPLSYRLGGHGHASGYRRHRAIQRAESVTRGSVLVTRKGRSAVSDRDGVTS